MAGLFGTDQTLRLSGLVWLMWVAPARDLVEIFQFWDGGGRVGGQPTAEPRARDGDDLRHFVSDVRLAIGHNVLDRQRPLVSLTV